jgi:hypothetical protein
MSQMRILTSYSLQFFLIRLFLIILKIDWVVLIDSDIDNFSYHVGTDVKIVVFLVFYVGLAMSHYVLS